MNKKIEAAPTLNELLLKTVTRTSIFLDVSAVSDVQATVYAGFADTAVDFYAVSAVSKPAVLAKLPRSGANLAGLAARRCAKVQPGAEKHHGFSSSDNWRNSRAPSLERGFFHGEHDVVQRDPFMAGRVGAPQGAPVPIAGLLTRHGLSPSFSSERGSSRTVQLEAIMAKTLTLGNTPTTPSSTRVGRLIHTRIIKSRSPTLAQPKPEIDLIANRQLIENALSMALHFIRTADTKQGVQQATAKAMRASSLLKLACSEFKIGGAA